jgi:glucose-6-phosphate isomerase
MSVNPDALVAFKEVLAGEQPIIGAETLRSLLNDLRMDMGCVPHLTTCLEVLFKACHDNHGQPVSALFSTAVVEAAVDADMEGLSQQTAVLGHQAGPISKRWMRGSDVFCKVADTSGPWFEPRLLGRFFVPNRWTMCHNKAIDRWRREMNIDFKFVPKHLATRSEEAMKPVLMDPEAQGPEVHYYMIRGGVDQKNITVWEPGTVGGEYIKTFGHYHVGKLDETYWMIYGEGVLLMQKLEEANGQMVADRVAEFKAVQVKAGDEQFIPAGYGHLVANVGPTYFVTADDSPVDFEEHDPSSLPGHADYKPVEQMQGFAFYVVERDGKPALLRNPRYKTVANVDAGGLPVVKE